MGEQIFYLIFNNGSSSFRKSDACESDEEIDINFDIREDISSNDIASTLVMLKKKHRLSTKCIDDIIRLLKVLGVHKTPSSWHRAKQLLIKSKPNSINHFICPVCSETTANE